MPAALDIIVPVYKNAALTSRCLDSLAQHMPEIAALDPRLVLINDSPDDEAVRELLERFSRRHAYATVLENEKNLGFVRTVNRGLAAACKARRDVLLVNSDTETFAGTLQNLAAAMDADPQIGFASPRSNNASFCSLPHFFGGTEADAGEAHRRWQRLSRTMPAFHFTPTAVGFYLYIRNAVLANFGGLDPEFGVGYEEENDLILRAGKVGFRAVLVNNAFAYHAGSASFSLVDMNLREHQTANLVKMRQRHAEYQPLVERYEASAHFRAETLLGHVLPSTSGRLKLVFDLSTVGPNFNGTNELATAIIDGFCRRHAGKFDLHAICREDAFKFHDFGRHACLHRHEPDLQTRERFAIGIQVGQPFSVHALSVLEDLAVVNVIGMLDTIADDCGPLSITHPLDTLWGHVARHANGLFFISKFAERTLLTRYPDALERPRYARLLPTQLGAYRTEAKSPTAQTPSAQAPSADHVLIMGNHFAHKDSDHTAELLRAAFPRIQIVVLGRENRVHGNVRAYKSGAVGDSLMKSLYARASVVVLPSYSEGFGLGLMHALAMGKVVVARDIPVMREILATYRRVSGVFLYADDAELPGALRLAMAETGSSVDDQSAETWVDWVDGLAEFCAGLSERDDIFERMAHRIRAGDLIRKAEMLERLHAAKSAPAGATARGESRATGYTDGQGRIWTPVAHADELLARDGEEFIYGAYVTILDRLPDPDGLMNYLNELQEGIDKRLIISRLRQSAEGRRKNLPLGGYRPLIWRNRLSLLLGGG